MRCTKYQTTTPPGFQLHFDSGTDTCLHASNIRPVVVYLFIKQQKTHGNHVTCWQLSCLCLASLKINKSSNMYWKLRGLLCSLRVSENCCPSLPTRSLLRSSYYVTITTLPTRVMRKLQGRDCQIVSSVA